MQTNVIFMEETAEEYRQLHTQIYHRDFCGILPSLPCRKSHQCLPAVQCSIPSKPERYLMCSRQKHQRVTSPAIPPLETQRCHTFNIWVWPNRRERMLLFPMVIIAASLPVKEFLSLRKCALFLAANFPKAFFFTLSVNSNVSL